MARYNLIKYVKLLKICIKYTSYWTFNSNDQVNRKLSNFKLSADVDKMKIKFVKVCFLIVFTAGIMFIIQHLELLPWCIALHFYRRRPKVTGRIFPVVKQQMWHLIQLLHHKCKGRHLAKAMQMKAYRLNHDIQ